jgi:sugar/nucleoside kinase (ribokinase family)
LYELVGIGALNLDLIATQRRLMMLGPHLLGELRSRFEHGTEQPVDKEVIEILLSQMGSRTFDAFLGGSSFNVVHTMASTNPGFRLGYIGVAGRTEILDLDFCDALEELGIDTRFILKKEEFRSGVCISYIHEGERSLLTHSGANVAMADHLSSQYSEIIAYLSQAKSIHISSFFDERTPGVLLSLLTETKRRNPWLKISFDPGHHWMKFLTGDILGLLRLTDLLFLNDREFRMLGRNATWNNELELAERIFQVCNPATPLIILKQYDGIKLFYKLGERLLAPCYANVVMPPDSIEDDTGAGDVFAGGFLTAVLIPVMEIRHGIDLGLRLVRAKLLSAGSSSFNSFPSIFSELISEISSKTPT